MPETERRIKRTMNERNRTLGERKFNFENRWSNRILFKKFKIKFTNQATGSESRDTMLAEMKTKDRVVTITKMGTSVRTTTEKKRVKNIVPGNRRESSEGSG